VWTIEICSGARSPGEQSALLLGWVNCGGGGLSRALLRRFSCGVGVLFRVG
jgi:hypothetical protein